MKTTYSTADLAKMLDVNESTVKRWSDTGDLACIKTRGGHRRFGVATVMEFIHRNKLSASFTVVDTLANEDLHAHVLAGNIHKLIPELRREMKTGNVQGVLNILRIAYAAKPNLIQLFTEVVFPPLTEIGEEWQNNSLTVDQEHIASNALREALALFHSEVYQKQPNGLRAVCACSEGEWHDIVIRCVGYYLESEGWQVLFLGQASPAKSLESAIKTLKPDLVALSATIIQNERRFLRAINNTIHPAVRRAKARLAIGGPGIKARLNGRVKADFLCDTIADCEEIANRKSYSDKK